VFRQHFGLLFVLAAVAVVMFWPLGFAHQGVRLDFRLVAFT
jgi:hypothetical protein